MVGLVLVINDDRFGKFLFWFILFFLGGVFFKDLGIMFWLNLLFINFVFFLINVIKFWNLGLWLSLIIFLVYLVYFFFKNIGNFFVSFCKVFMWFKLDIYLVFMLVKVWFVVFKCLLNFSRVGLLIFFK